MDTADSKTDRMDSDLKLAAGRTLEKQMSSNGESVVVETTVESGESNVDPNKRGITNSNAAKVFKSDASGDSEAGIQLIENPPQSMRKRTRSQDETLERRKRRRRLRRMLREAGDFPSFVALISSAEEDVEDTDNQGEEEEQENTPEVIYIDVDEYLGLKSDSESKETCPSRQNQGRSTVEQYGARHAATSTPQDEGFYTGQISVAMNDADPAYLSTLQQLIRNNLEFFSATVNDASKSQAGRRYPIVVGKVGVRCIHCANISLRHEAAVAAKMADAPVAPDRAGSLVPGPNSKISGAGGNDDLSKPIDPARIWPNGSVSYPVNIAGLHSMCSQKVQLHFETCPNIPPAIMAQLYRESNKAGESRIRNREVPASMYYSVAAKRLGLVNVKCGIRFGRDLTLEPLPLDAVLAQELQEGNEKKATHFGPATVPDLASSISSPVKAAPSGPRMTVDAEAEQVLAEALQEPDDRPNHLGRTRDKEMVSAYIFLIICQISICRAVPADLATRGKKTRKMRIGFAGLCCRHCLKVREEKDGPELARAHGASGFSCRSFSSEPDTLGSTISNSFAEHLAKCSNVPERTRKALASYKRIHAQQMAELPFGSQGKKFREIWGRLRVADVPEDEMMKLVRSYKPGQPDLPPIISTEADRKIVPPKPAPKQQKSRPSSKSKSSKPKGKDGSFPFSKNAEAQKILSIAEESWDPDVNDGMILPSDRDLVSDYVFLTLRQLKVAMPTQADLAKGRRGLATNTIIAGMCCMHCDGKDPSMIAPSCRTFPTAPDNYASAFNTQLYNHMQGCHFIQADVKRALADLKKIHSPQIAKLKFGAQRQFFTLLYKRLRKVNVKGKLPPGGNLESPSPRLTDRASRSPNTKSNGGRSRGRVTRRSDTGDDTILEGFKFFEAPLQSFFCQRCRMVPLQFRARGSLTFAKPSLDFMSEHHGACKEDGFDLWFCVESLKAVLKTGFDVASFSHPLFKEVILECFGRNEELAAIFTSEIVKVLQMHRHGGVTQAVENYIKAKSQGMWSQLPQFVDTARVLQAFEKFAAEIKGLSPRLADHSALVKYLLLVCPSLKLDNDQEKRDSQSEEGSNDDGDEEPEDEKDDELDETYDGASAGVVDTPNRRRGGKELRKGKAGEEQEREDGAGGDEDQADVQVVPAVRPHGKELRREKTEEDNDSAAEGSDEEEHSDDEVIEIERGQRGGKEVRRKHKTTLNDPDDSGDDLSDDDDYEIMQGEQESERSNGDIFDNDGPLDVDDGENQGETDNLMREGILEEVD